jgi:hypothetical protein
MTSNVFVLGESRLSCYFGSSVNYPGIILNIEIREHLEIQGIIIVLTALFCMQ